MRFAVPAPIAKSSVLTSTVPPPFRSSILRWRSFLPAFEAPQLIVSPVSPWIHATHPFVLNPGYNVMPPSTYNVCPVT